MHRGTTSVMRSARGACDLLALRAGAAVVDRSERRARRSMASARMRSARRPLTRAARGGAALMDRINFATARTAREAIARSRSIAGRARAPPQNERGDAGRVMRRTNASHDWATFRAVVSPRSGDGLAAVELAPSRGSRQPSRMLTEQG